MASNEQPPLSLSNTLGAVGVLGLVAIMYVYVLTLSTWLTANLCS